MKAIFVNFASKTNVHFSFNTTVYCINMSKFLCRQICGLYACNVMKTLKLKNSCCRIYHHIYHKSWFLNEKKFLLFFHRASANRNKCRESKLTYKKSLFSYFWIHHVILNPQGRWFFWLGGGGEGVRAWGTFLCYNSKSNFHVMTKKYKHADIFTRKVLLLYMK